MESTKDIIVKNNDKSGISLYFKHNKVIIKDPVQISNTFCNFFKMLVKTTPLQYVNPKSNLYNILRITLNIIQII